MFNGKQLFKMYHTLLNANRNRSTFDIRNVTADTHAMEKQLVLYFQQQKPYAPLSISPHGLRPSK